MGLNNKEQGDLEKRLMQMKESAEQAKTEEELRALQTKIHELEQQIGEYNSLKTKLEEEKTKRKELESGYASRIDYLENQLEKEREERKKDREEVEEKLKNYFHSSRENKSDSGYPSEKKTREDYEFQSNKAKKFETNKQTNQDAKYNSIYEKVKNIIADQFFLQKKDIYLENNIFKDFGADSLDAVELVMEFEDSFNINIPDEEAEKIQTVKEIVDYLYYNVH